MPRSTSKAADPSKSKLLQIQAQLANALYRADREGRTQAAECLVEAQGALAEAISAWNNETPVQGQLEAV